MNDINRLLVFLLLAGLLYALYRYQHVLFGPVPNNHKQLTNTKNNDIKKIQYKRQDIRKPISKNNNHKSTKEKEVSIDNISQLSMGSLENEDGNMKAYKLDSLLGSIDSGTANGTDGSDGTMNSENSSFFFKDQ
ncbi:cyclophilin-type peptidyl-prolyl cis-trans isomerase [Fadolivirus algeromassiliense]|jgi:hypothetical protein|uniref:Cyclophilin-type peptidyl-prolyl cis-trans isomerase n=1 Tax=Fadolivirus FV1/VV64 TaxID=3070911 RepID=A0A7D3V5Q4_9VIRU|nr:cyclophilin-type peptidyl-prolyl cis-trans isomerase [Fadolivirus algeromassiliense]QKF94152.1 cyclophilin-type peptidyl-prolyl cis-trans isomerase [Fadolivirus FV1/VV64]